MGFVDECQVVDRRGLNVRAISCDDLDEVIGVFQDRRLRGRDREDSVGTALYLSRRFGGCG
jgi:hypothetical protein